MEQMNLDGLEAVAVDYESGSIPVSVKTFEPSVYKHGLFFCCILGPAPETGVFGCGDTLRAALTDWDKQLQERIRDYREGDEVAEYILDTIDASTWAIW
jgi:hypothetical protein